ncbi:N-acetylglucosamine-6-phosphate deacetylase [Aestuariicoccus sp. MJ-SS9]|uniref:N-acetylglucosamine-6-phosphate deacetylase n=1 Tax=Aestuariicoccus sp. MJ-SS9 TaxID=3079855 RepID=UPI00290D4B12|nr:N-acetylglucosamine-6-phosphate deacetylase [Aestuariicoccus sp. MJ-SS9]MDU8909729.1 N-acetylglucosamine-6-phosphate deacetylase [Aestuariicoccus sp. MJ-SS9]
MTRIAYAAARVFDGQNLLTDHAVLSESGICAGVVPVSDVPEGYACQRLEGMVLPGFVDLQVNGGGGVMFNDATDIAGLRRIAEAHAGTGTLGILPTLITDTPERTTQAIRAVREALAAGVPGILGLHLEGPHLSRARKGAHEAALIRPMQDSDLQELCAAARDLPNLMVTVAPEAASLAQIAALAEAGALVSLGHSDCDYETAMAAFGAGARCATHLFNAMSPLTSRAPGLVGAALDHGAVAAGLIADGIHVHPVSLRLALRANRGPGRPFLLTDAMAPLGTDDASFTLNGRRIRRAGGRLTLEDGTLAGADLTMTQAIGVTTGPVGVPMAEALAMATSGPTGLLRDAPGFGRFERGQRLRAIHWPPEGAVASL